jgi:hypothetical protein
MRPIITESWGRMDELQIEQLVPTAVKTMSDAKAMSQSALCRLTQPA